MSLVLLSLLQIFEDFKDLILYIRKTNAFLKLWALFALKSNKAFKNSTVQIA